jgi:glutathione S-transferase
LADFSVYHSVWFTQVQVPILAGILDATPVLKAWTERMAAFGHGDSTKMSADEALAVAKAASPLPLADEFFQDEHGIPLGSMVTVAAESFGTEPTTGELVSASRTRYTLRRHDDRTGTVHVHFPRLGFILKKADA